MRDRLLDNEKSLGELDIRGKKIRINLSPDGMFKSGSPYEAQAATLEALRDKLLVLTKKAGARLSIPATKVTRGRELVDVYLLGRHGGNGNVMYLMNGETKQEASYYSQGWYRRMTPEEKIEFKRLQAESEKADSAFRKFREPLEIQPGDVVDAALNEAVKEGS